MSLWRCVELCRSSLLLILKCFWMLPLIIYKHLNTLPASCPCFHKWWLAYHYSNSEALLERTLLTKATARKTTPGLSCSCESEKPHLTGTGVFMGHWALKNYKSSSSGLQPTALDGPPDFWQSARSWEHHSSPLPQHSWWAGSSWALFCLCLQLHSQGAGEVLLYWHSTRCSSSCTGKGKPWPNQPHPLLLYLKSLPGVRDKV